MKAVLQIILFEPAGDVLAFLPGQEEIDETQKMIVEKLALLKKQSECVVLCLYANLPPHEQNKVFIQVGGNKRKVILSTNIAETSVTIPGVKYVVDCGLVKQRVFKNTTGVDALQVTTISKSSATQRAGRAGRVGPGKCFRVYSEETHDQFQEVTTPEILRCNLSGVILSLKAIGIKDVSKVDFLDRPE